MKQFIFHIGMHKCASTTLQNNVFRFEPGALGTYKGLKAEENFGKQFQRLSPVGGRQTGSLSGVSEWIERVLDTHPNIDRFIVSSEFLCQSNKLSDRPIIRFLDEINKKLLDGKNIKVVIVFRNQAELMASEYAQISNTRYKSSQQDFEKWIAKKLKHRKRSRLDWGEWAKRLVDTFGRENVCILLLEEINELIFWEELVDFIEGSEVDAIELYEQNTKSRKNKRKIAKNTWGLRPFDLKEKAKDDIHKIKQLMSGFGVHGEWVDKSVNHSIKMRVKYLKALGYQDQHLRDSEITLTDELRKLICDAYRMPNRLLSEISGKNISKLGYT